jgi:hypothetical protein
MKTVKRKANVGERILITDTYRTEDRYKNGDILTVTGDGKDFRVYANGMLVFTEEYEVIIETEEANEMPNGVIEQMQAEIAELKTKVAALEGRKSLKQIAEEVYESVAKGPSIAEYLIPKSPQQVRDEIIAKAKADVEALRNKRGDYEVTDPASYAPWSCVADFIVNAEKRTVVVLIKGVHSGKLRAKGIAKADPSDCFNSSIGKAIALRRALGLEVPAVYYNAPAPTEVRVGDVVKSRQNDIYSVVENFVWDDDKLSISHVNKYRKSFRIIDDSCEE